MEQKADALSTVQALLGTQHITSQLVLPSCLYYLCLERSENDVLGNKRMDRFGKVQVCHAALKRIFIAFSKHKLSHGTSELLSMGSPLVFLTDLKMQSRFSDCINKHRANTAREDKLPFAISFNS